MGKKTTALFLALVLVCTLAGCEKKEKQPSMYAQAENWAYLETDKTADADVFFICPTAQSYKEAITGRRELPSGVKAYSTRGGIS